MEILPRDIREFQEIWKKEFKEEISEEFARDQAHQLIDLVIALLRQKKK